MNEEQNEDQQQLKETMIRIDKAEWKEEESQKTIKKTLLESE